MLVFFCCGFYFLSADCQVLCPVDSIIDSDDTRLTESQLSAEEIDFCLIYYSDFPRYLKKMGTHKKLSGSASYYATFPDCAKKLRGYILKQRALILRTEWRLAMLNADNGMLAQAQVDSISNAYEEARSQFCRFLQTTDLSD
jgi:hypothetical protein